MIAPVTTTFDGPLCGRVQNWDDPATLLSSALATSCRKAASNSMGSPASRAVCDAAARAPASLAAERYIVSR